MHCFGSFGAFGHHDGLEISILKNLQFMLS